MNSTVIYSYLSRKWIRILPPEQNIKKFSQRKTLHLLSRLAGTDYDTSTKPRVLRAGLYISILYEWRDRLIKSAPSLKSVLFGHNWTLVYSIQFTIITYSSWLIYCSAVYSYLIPTNSMEQSPFSQANSSSGSQDICHMLRNPKVHYHIHNRPSPLPVLTQLMQSIFTTLKTWILILFTIIPLILCYKYLTNICLM
jgi:hypothetical protein